MYNVLCDFLATNARDLENGVFEDPDVTPLERWALYSFYPTYHKLMGDLTNGIYYTLGYQDLLEYILSKYSIPSMARSNQLSCYTEISI